MSALIVALVLAATDGPVLQPCTIVDPCSLDDGPRLKVTLVNEIERADQAERRADLLEQAAKVAQDIAQRERQNADMWRGKAEELALPPPWYTSPGLWTAVGFVGGVALTIAVVGATRG